MPGKCGTVSIFNTTCKTTFYVVSLSYGERTTRFVPLFFIPFALKKGVEMRKILSEVVKKVTEIVKISSERITISSDFFVPSSAKKLFSSQIVKSLRRKIALKMKRFGTSLMVCVRKTEIWHRLSATFGFCLLPCTGSPVSVPPDGAECKSF